MRGRVESSSSFFQGCMHRYPKISYLTFLFLCFFLGLYFDNAQFLGFLSRAIYSLPLRLRSIFLFSGSRVKTEQEKIFKYLKNVFFFETVRKEVTFSIFENLQIKNSNLFTSLRKTFLYKLKNYI